MTRAVESVNHNDGSLMSFGYCGAVVPVVPSVSERSSIACTHASAQHTAARDSRGETLSLSNDSDCSGHLR
jgi:hypothetical protein